MMAQKTPVANLTLSGSGTWTSLWHLPSDRVSFRQALADSVMAKVMSFGFHEAGQRLLTKNTDLTSNGTLYHNDSSFHVKVGKVKRYVKRIKVSQLDAYKANKARSGRLWNASRIQVGAARTVSIHTPRFQPYLKRVHTAPVILGHGLNQTSDLFKRFPVTSAELDPLTQSPLASVSHFRKARAERPLRYSLHIAPIRKYAPGVQNKRTFSTTAEAQSHGAEALLVKVKKQNPDE